MSQQPTTIDFPYGNKPGWEFDNADADLGLKSVSGSLVILQSLRQSREKWLYHTFPKFTSKARGAKTADPPPPHTVLLRGRCDLVVGPHIFPDTAFYEVHYMQTSSASSYSHTPSAPASATQHSTYQATTVQPAQTPAQNPIAPTEPATPTSSSSDTSDLSQVKLALGGGLEYTITADLVAKIYREASTNPIFASKFRQAVDPNATQEQIRNFAFALPHLPGVRVSGAPTSLTLSTESVYFPPIREWDIVVEFSEAPTERWLIPRGTIASCMQLVNKTSTILPDVIFSFQMPLPESQPKPQDKDQSNTENPLSKPIPPHIVKHTLRKAPAAVYDLIVSWIGGEERNKQNAETLAKLPSRRKVYLSHRLPPGPLCTQLQAASSPSYLKPIKQGPSNPSRQKRKQTQKPKRSLAEAATTTATPTSDIPTTSDGRENKEKEPKRRRYQTNSKPAPMPIRCISCFKTDVPLMMGGRYCRECVDAGKANVAIPQVARASQTYVAPYVFSPSVVGATPQQAPSQTISTTQDSTTSVPQLPAASRDDVADHANGTGTSTQTFRADS